MSIRLGHDGPEAVEMAAKTSVQASAECWAAGMKIYTVEGRIVEAHDPQAIFLALWKTRGYWQPSGIFYHSADEATADTERMLAARGELERTEAIVVVKVTLPKEIR